jgi:hypothetical protein
MALPRTSRVLLRDEYLNLQFRSTGQLVDFVLHPEMVELNQTHFEPLYQLFLLIREEWTSAPEAENSLQHQRMRGLVREYLDLAVSVSAADFDRF